jgi:hypothetical protein
MSDENLHLLVIVRIRKNAVAKRLGSGSRALEVRVRDLLRRSTGANAVFHLGRAIGVAGLDFDRSAWFPTALLRGAFPSRSCM